MIQLAEKYNNSLRTSASTQAEVGAETDWTGKSQVTLAYLLERTKNTPEIVVVNRLTTDVQSNITGKVGLYTDGNKISPIASRLKNVVSEIPVVPQYRSHREVFQALQEWEGCVTNVDGATFTARLQDIQNKNNPEEEGDFQVEDLRRDDIAMLKIGAVFRWTIGYVIKQDGAKRRSSAIVFRRLPQWTSRDMLEADNKVERLIGAIDWQ